MVGCDWDGDGDDDDDDECWIGFESVMSVVVVDDLGYQLRSEEQRR